MLPCREMPLLTAWIRNHKLPRECLVRILPVSTIARPVLDLSPGLARSDGRIATRRASRPVPPTEPVPCVGSALSVQSLQLDLARAWPATEFLMPHQWLCRRVWCEPTERLAYVRSTAPSADICRFAEIFSVKPNTQCLQSSGNSHFRASLHYLEARRTEIQSLPVSTVAFCS